MSTSVHSIAEKEGPSAGIEGDFPLDEGVVQGKSLQEGFQSTAHSLGQLYRRVARFCQRIAMVPPHGQSQPA